MYACRQGYQMELTIAQFCCQMALTHGCHVELTNAPHGGYQRARTSSYHDCQMALASFYRF
jgi:hypothetical protein